ncbi:MAG: glycosyltransferase family 4 protein [Ktedonobacteraceae bacterium]
MAKLNVLMVTPRYHPYVGGIETHVHEVGRHLTSRGVHVTLLTTMPHTLPSPLSKEEEIEGMHVIRVRAWPPQRDYYVAPEIYSIIQRGGWNLVHCQGCNTFVPPIAMFAAQQAKIPYVVTFHTGGHSSRFRTSIRSTQWKILRPLFANASRLIGVSQFEAVYFRNLLRLPEERFSVIPNGASFTTSAHFTPKTPTQSLIVSIGRLERYKGHHHLITALPKIREWLPTAQLMIVGAGPYESTLRRLAQRIGVAEYVTIRSIPASDRQAMAELISQAMLVALLSEYEAHPIAVMEALALQRPVLVANTSGLRELAEHQLVHAVPLDSTPEEVAIAVVQQIESPLIPAQLTLPTWEDCARELEDIYNNVSIRGHSTERLTVE